MPSQTVRMTVHSYGGQIGAALQDHEGAGRADPEPGLRLRGGASPREAAR